MQNQRTRNEKEKLEEQTQPVNMLERFHKEKIDEKDWKKRQKKIAKKDGCN
jgi:hypothetical protein